MAYILLPYILKWYLTPQSESILSTLLQVSTYVLTIQYKKVLLHIWPCGNTTTYCKMFLNFLLFIYHTIFIISYKHSPHHNNYLSVTITNITLHLNEILQLHYTTMIVTTILVIRCELLINYMVQKKLIITKKTLMWKAAALQH